MLGANDEIIICVTILACWSQIHETTWCLFFLGGGGSKTEEKELLNGCTFSALDGGVEGL